MLSRLKKLIRYRGFLLGFVLLILGCVGTNMITPQPVKYPQDPKRNVIITIDTNQRQEFFDQLRKFADEHNFKILIDTGPRSSEDFHIEMTREDIDIIGDNPFAPGEYHFGFYHADLLHPAPESAFDDLVNDLKRFVSEVPGATFTVEK